MNIFNYTIPVIALAMNAHSMTIIENGASLDKLISVFKEQNIEFTLEPLFSIYTPPDTDYCSASIASGVILIATYEKSSKKIINLTLKLFKEPRESKADDIHVVIKNFYFKNNKFHFTSSLDVNPPKF